MNEEIKLKLINEVTSELKNILQIPDGLSIGECNATCYVGRCYIKENKIVISRFIKTNQDYKDVLAHELIHFMCPNHGKDFKEYCRKINSLGLGYNVRTNARQISNIDEIRDIRREKGSNRKSYIVWCVECGWCEIYKQKNHKLRNYRCPKCFGKLRQKQYIKGKTEIYRVLN